MSYLMLYLLHIMEHRAEVHSADPQLHTDVRIPAGRASGSAARIIPVSWMGPVAVPQCGV